MTDSNIANLFLPLYQDLQRSLDKKKPLLAHYTTVSTLEKILANGEVWFSNPLYMNDVEEVRFGVLQGLFLVMNSHEIAAACKRPDRTETFKQNFEAYYNDFANRHVLNTYVFCLSEHDANDNDGVLSMWRGYGANGNGVAIVFDTAQLQNIQASPLIVAEVEYAATTARLAWLKNLIAKFAQILSPANIPDDKLHIPALWLFERIVLFALFTKHHGFKEEGEWRVVYRPERDAARALTSMFHYSIGGRGVEPKLKFKVAPISGVTPADLSLTKFINRIILGPTIASPVAREGVLRMLEVLNFFGLKPKVVASTIPFRPSGLFTP